MDHYFQYIKNFIRKIQKQPVVYRKSGIHPHHDWDVLFFSMIVALFISGMWSYYIYTEVNNGTLFTVDAENVSTQVKIDTLLLRKISKRYEMKDEAIRKISESPKPIADPSL